MRSIFATTTLLAVSLLPTTLAEALQAAIVTIESSHGGAGQGLTNITVDIPLTATYSNQSALDEVSTLYLVDSRGVPLNSITCTPFLYANGSGDAGLAFNHSTPSFLSTNTVEVGSIVCISTHISFAPPSGSPGGPLPLSTSSTTKSGDHTKTMTSKHHGAGETSTLVKTTSVSGTVAVTSLASGSGSSGPSETGTSTSSASASLSSGNSASGITLGSEFFGGLALAGFGIAFAL